MSAGLSDVLSVRLRPQAQATTVPLRRLTITHLQRLYAHLRVSGRWGRRAARPKTVLNVHQILRTVVGDAEARGP